MKMKASIYVIIAVLGVALGLKLPDVLFAWMDSNASGRSQQYLTEAVEFGVEYPLSDYLRLAGGNDKYKSYDMGTGITSESDADSIYKAARNTLILLLDYQQKTGFDYVFPEAYLAVPAILSRLPKEGLPAREFSDEISIQITPVIAMKDTRIDQTWTSRTGGSDSAYEDVSQSERKMMTAVFWECRFWNRDNEIHMVFDDQSKKMLSMECYWSFESSLKINGKDLNEAVRGMGKAYTLFAQETYGFENPHIVSPEMPGDNRGTETYSQWEDMAAETEPSFRGTDTQSEYSETYTHKISETAISEISPADVETEPWSSIKILDRAYTAIYTIFSETSGAELTIPIYMGYNFYSINSPNVSTADNLFDKSDE